MVTYLKALIHQSSFASAIVTALSLCVLVAPVQASANDSVERWNIAMTDYAAGQPPPGLPPFVEARAFSMAHIAMLDALRVARASTAPANVDAAIAAAAHDVLISAFAPFGPNSFDSVYQSELAAIPNGPAETRGVSIGQQAAAAMLATRADEDIFAALSAPYTPGTSPATTRRHPPWEWSSARVGPSCKPLQCGRRSSFARRRRTRRCAAWITRWTSTRSNCSASRSAQGEPLIRLQSRSTGTRIRRSPGTASPARSLAGFRCSDTPVCTRP